MVFLLSKDLPLRETLNSSSSRYSTEYNNKAREATKRTSACKLWINRDQWRTCVAASYKRHPRSDAKKLCSVGLPCVHMPRHSSCPAPDLLRLQLSFAKHTPRHACAEFCNHVLVRQLSSLVSRDSLSPSALPG
nr:hypothetical protein CFP56_26098 [Quercus suber]